MVCVFPICVLYGSAPWRARAAFGMCLCRVCLAICVVRIRYHCARVALCAQMRIANWFGPLGDWMAPGNLRSWHDEDITWRTYIMYYVYSLRALVFTRGILSCHASVLNACSSERILKHLVAQRKTFDINGIHSQIYKSNYWLFA